MPAQDSKRNVSYARASLRAFEVRRMMSHRLASRQGPGFELRMILHKLTAPDSLDMSRSFVWAHFESGQPFNLSACRGQHGTRSEHECVGDFTMLHLSTCRLVEGVDQ